MGQAGVGEYVAAALLVGDGRLLCHMRAAFLGRGVEWQRKTAYVSCGRSEIDSRGRLGHAGLQLKHQEGTAEVGVARWLRHGCTVTKGVHELRVCDETRRAPTAEAPEGAARVGVEREQLLFAVLPADAHAIGRVEAEDTRRHVAHPRQQAREVVRRQPSNVLLPYDDGVVVRGTGQSGGA